MIQQKDGYFGLCFLTTLGLVFSPKSVQNIRLIVQRSVYLISYRLIGYFLATILYVFRHKRIVSQTTLFIGATAAVEW